MRLFDMPNNKHIAQAASVLRVELQQTTIAVRQAQQQTQIQSDIKQVSAVTVSFMKYFLLTTRNNAYVCVLLGHPCARPGRTRVLFSIHRFFG
jgi:hypothetical protein